MPTTRPVRVPFIAAMTAVLLFVASDLRAQTAEDENYSVVVEMTDTLKFKPEKITIKVGETVLWKNEPSTVPHTVTADPELANYPKNVKLPEGAEPFDSGRMQAGDTFKHTFDVPGLYRYFCIPHEGAGMVAEVEVEPADDAATTDEETTNGGAAAQKFDATHAKEGDGGKRTMVLGTHAPPRPDDYREATGFKKFLYWVGNWHPAGTDLPVGTLIAALLSEILLIGTRKEMFAAVTRFCVWLGGLSTIAVAVGGWCLAGFRFDDPHWLLETHRWWGTGTALGMIALVGLVEAAHRKNTPGTRWTFRAALVLGVAAILTTGFFGGAMIYGVDHYNWPG